jgi:hypothetical protein
MESNTYVQLQLKFRFSEKATQILKFDPIVLKVLNLLRNVKTLRTIGPTFYGLLRISEL